VAAMKATSARNCHSQKTWAGKLSVVEHLKYGGHVTGAHASTTHHDPVTDLSTPE